MSKAPDILIKGIWILYKDNVSIWLQNINDEERQYLLKRVLCCFLLAESTRVDNKQFTILKDKYIYMNTCTCSCREQVSPIKQKEILFEQIDKIDNILEEISHLPHHNYTEVGSKLSPGVWRKIN